MKLFLPVLLPFMSQADYSGQFCFTGNIKIGNETWSEARVMEALEPQVTAAVLKVANADTNLKMYLKMQGNCQADCLENVIHPTFSALYGKLGAEFVSVDEKHKHHDVFVDALCGAFRACYPQPPRGEVRKIAEAIFTAAFEGIDEKFKPKPYPAGVSCPNQGYEDAFPLNEFLDTFHNTIMTVMQTKPKMKKMFETEAMDCQKTCLQHTVPTSAMTLFQTNNYDSPSGIDAMTGAIHACFPGFPHDDINVLVKETSDVMAQLEAEAAEKAAAERAAAEQLYARKGTKMPRPKSKYVSTRRRRSEEKEAVAEAEVAMTQEASGADPIEVKPSESYGFLSWCSIIVTGFLALFVGVALGRRMAKSGDGGFAASKSYQMLPTTFGRTKEGLHSI